MSVSALAARALRFAVLGLAAGVPSLLAGAEQASAAEPLAVDPTAVVQLAADASAIAPEVQAPPRWHAGMAGAVWRDIDAAHAEGGEEAACAQRWAAYREVGARPALAPGHAVSPGWNWGGWARQRVVADGVSPVESMGPLASEALRLTRSTEIEYRARVGGSAAWTADSGFLRKAEAQVEAEVRSWDRDDPALRDGPALLRRGNLELTTLAGQFTLGRTLSTWGLGLLAQDGTDDPLQFGVRRGGNVVTRLGWGFLPAALWHKGDPLQALPLAIALAYDWVVRDDVAFYPGDTANNAIAAVLYRGSALQAGVYGVLRSQRDAQGLPLDVRILDGFARWRTDWSHGGHLEVSAEGAWTTGTTGWLKSLQHTQGVEIDQLGGVARLQFGNRRATFRLEGGLASGDGRPLDGTLRNQRFNSDYRVGLVMFPQAQRILSEQAAANLADPRYVQAGPSGLERLRTEGAVTQALYLHQVTRFEPLRHLAVLVGATIARSPTAVADPFRSWLAGGVPTGPRGAQGGRDLGFELDAGIEASHHFGRWLRGALAIQGGFWVPGKAFDDATGQPMAAVAAWQTTIQLQAGL